MIFILLCIDFFYCFCFSESYYFVLQNECYTPEGSNIDEAYEFLRLQKSMEMVGFTADVQKRFVVYSTSVKAKIGKVGYSKKKIHPS